MIYVGFDPGLGGAIASCETRGNKVLSASVEKMPEGPEDIKQAFLQRITTAIGAGGAIQTERIRIAVERVGARLSRNADGTDRKIGIASIAKLIRNAGHIEGILVGLGFKPNIVQPRVWQGHFGLLMPKKDYPDKSPDWIYSEKKRRCRDLAAKCFPDIKPALWKGDALLLAEYCRRLHEGGLTK